LGAFLAQGECAEAGGLTRANHRQLILDAAESNALLAQCGTSDAAVSAPGWEEVVCRSQKNC
jgi:hypothetical protein